jgi:uncharacterized protein
MRVGSGFSAAKEKEHETACTQCEAELLRRMRMDQLSSGVNVCSNCGLESAGEVCFCAGCGTDLSGAELSQADAVRSVHSGEGVHFTGVMSPGRHKSLRIHLLEWFLVLFALLESGILNLGYHLYLTRGSLSINYSMGVDAWIYFYLRTVSTLGILGYVLFRNSRWCEEPSARSAGSAYTISKHGGARTTRRGSHRVRIFEFSLVLFAAFAGSIFYSIEVLVGCATISDEPRVYKLTHDVYSMLRYAAELGLLGYVLDRTSRGFQDLGLRWTSRDVAVALPLALGAGLADRLLLPITFSAAQTLSGHPSQVADVGNLVVGTSISVAAVVRAILNGCFEELIVRGYLMTEVRRFTGSILFALFCSVAVQVSYHFYQGGPAALAHAGSFLVLAAYYAKTNRILPVILAHIAFDLNWLVMYALRLP